MQHKVQAKERLSLDLSSIDGVLEAAIAVARRYRELTGKPLRITGEIAEIEAASRLGLELSEARQPGYDAIRREGNTITRIQIKGRRIDRSSGRQAHLGKIRVDLDWDTVLLVPLDEDFDAESMHEAEKNDVEEALLAPGSKARNERGALAVSRFKSISRQVWPTEMLP